MAVLEVTEIFEVLNILTTPKQHDAPKSEKKDASENQNKSVIDAILEEKLDAFEEIFCNSKYEKFKQEFLKKKYDHEDRIETVHWKFALTCLKVLDLLATSLNHRLIEFKKIQKLQQQKELKPSQAPPLSPDALSIGQQKTVLTTMQFISMLGISPALQNGVGIPIEMKSEFGRMIATSTTCVEFSDLDKRIHLLICLKVLIKCIKCPSLGALILSRNLNDLLAALLQSVYGYPSSDNLPDSKMSEVNNPTTEFSGNQFNHVKHPDSSSNGTSTLPTDSEISKSKNSKSGGPSDGIEDVKNSDSPTKRTPTGSSDGTENVKNLDSPTNLTPGSPIDGEEDAKNKNSDPPTNQMPGSPSDGTKDVKISNSPTNWTPASVVDSQIQKQKQILSLDSDINAKNEETLQEKPDMFVQEHVAFLEVSLQEILTRVYQPMVVRELLLLQGGPQQVTTKERPCRKVVMRSPAWLRKICSKLLTDILTKPKGVINVLKGMLDGVPGSDTPGEIKESVTSDWKKCDAVAKVISFCPMKSSSLEEYYKMVSPQVLELIHYPDKRVARQFLRVACSTISYMMSQNAELTTTYLICPLLQPLISYVNTHDADCKPVAMVAEHDLSSCIENIHKVFVSGLEPDSPVIKCLRPVCSSIFMLYCFMYNSASHLRSFCHDIVVTYLKQSDKKDSLMCLKSWILPAQHKSGNMFPRMHSDYGFAYSCNGGVTIVNRLTQWNDEEQETLGEPKTIVVEAMLAILVDLQKEGLVGDFFLSMLEELMDIVTMETGSHREELTDLEASETCALTTIQSHINILHLLAAICEKIGPSCIEDKKQTLKFVKVTLERAVFVYSHAGDEVTTIFESETLTMALGLLTAILGGGLQLTEEDREKLKELLPLLQDLSDEHPDPFIQEMAADLRIAIATYGAVFSEILKNPAKSSADRSKEGVKQHAKKKVEQQAKNKPLIEEIPVNEDAAELITKTKDMKVENKSENNDDERVSEIKNNSENDKEGISEVQKNYPENNNCRVSEIQNISENNAERMPEIQNSSEKDAERVSEIQNSSENDGNGSVSEIQKAFEELCDPLIPVRGHALIMLAKLIRDKHPDAMDKKDLLLKIFLENLSHIDSYLYLASINGLAGLADIYPDIVIMRLVEEFSKPTAGDKKYQSTETRLKIGECLVKATRNLGDMVSKYRNVLLAAFLTGARDPDGLVRASSISNLGEICKLLRFSLGSVVHEVFNCCSSLLKSDTEVKVREAAALMLCLLLQGLDKDITKVLDSVIKDLYKLLKYSLIVEKEDSVKLHVTLALNELDTIMRGLLFPEQKLQKKIRVLDPD